MVGTSYVLDTGCAKEIARTAAFIFVTEMFFLCSLDSMQTLVIIINNLKGGQHNGKKFKGL